MAGTFTALTLYRAQPGTVEGTLYTVPAATTAIVKQIIVANTTGSAATVSLSVVPSAGAAAAANRIMQAVSIAANTTYTLDLSYPMATGDFVSGLQGTGSAITVHVLGVEET